MIAELPASRLHGESRPDSVWTTTNLGEAMPGVLTPLSWSMWGNALELATRRMFLELGVLSAREAEFPADVADRTMSAFFGRPVLRLEFWCEIGDRLPGTSGVAVARQLASYTPPTLETRPRRRGYPRAVAALVGGARRSPALVRREREDVAAWYARSQSALAAGGETTERETTERETTEQETTEQRARELLAEANRRFRHCVYRQGKTFFCGTQVVYDVLTRLAATTSVPADSLMGGYGGHEEGRMVADLWECSRDRLDIGSFLARYGHHGPNEGELSSRVWREDPAPVRDLVARYRTRAEESSPAATRTRLATERAERERRFLAELPAVQRPAARLVLRLAGAYVPLRGVAKASFLQCLDVARASARVLGTGWARSGALADPEDVFFLTAEEIAAGPPESARELVAQRRAERAEFERVDLPPVFTGQPLPERRPTRPAGDLAGIGVSPGVVEGIARVVEDPSFAEFEEGEILVARTTDPSWASVMFLSAGLVVDIGGPMSHAAVVARELGIPCVMNTQAGTSVIRTGDRCRIDGTSGAVQVLGRG